MRDILIYIGCIYREKIDCILNDGVFKSITFNKNTL